MKTQRKEESSYVLNIIIVARNLDISKRILFELREQLFDHIISENKYKIFVKDKNGIANYAILPLKEFINDNRGIHIDQIILDQKYSEFNEEEMIQIKKAIIKYSCVPLEFMIMNAEDLFVRGEY